MKRTSLILTSLLMIFALACKKDNDTAPPPSKVHLKDSLLVYLPFNGNMADSSGHGNATTSVGGASLTYDEHGYSNSAFGGNGNGESILITNNGSIKFDTAFSISFNFMIRAFGTQNFVSMVEYNTGFGASFGIGTNIPGLTNFALGVPDSTASCDNYNLPGNTFVDTTQFSPQPEGWYNIIAVFHKGTLQTYINGELISTKTGGSTTAHICPNAKLIIGGWWQADPTSINGKLDEFRLYNRVLNTDEIAELSKDFQ